MHVKSVVATVGTGFSWWSLQDFGLVLSVLVSILTAAFIATNIVLGIRKDRREEKMAEFERTLSANPHTGSK